MVGDLNLPYIDWQAYSWRQNQFYDNFFSKFVLPTGMIQLVNEPTLPSSGNILDLLFTTHAATVLSLKIMQPLDVRLDHKFSLF